MDLQDIHIGVLMAGALGFLFLEKSVSYFFGKLTKNKCKDCANIMFIKKELGDIKDSVDKVQKVLALHVMGAKNGITDEEKQRQLADIMDIK